MVDLNLQANAILPIQDQKSEQMGCCCCISGNVQCNVSIPRCGYVTGENIPLNFIISNNSRDNVTEVIF